jgi:hypothetical protein
MNFVSQSPCLFNRLIIIQSGRKMGFKEHFTLHEENMRKYYRLVTLNAHAKF